MKVFVVSQYDLISSTDSIQGIFKNKDNANKYKKELENINNIDDDYYRYYLDEHEVTDE